MIRTVRTLSILLSAVAIAWLPETAVAQTQDRETGLPSCYDRFHFIPFGEPTADSYRVLHFVPDPTEKPPAPIAQEIASGLNECFTRQWLSKLELSVLFQRVNDYLFARGYPTSGIRKVQLDRNGEDVHYNILFGRAGDVEFVANRRDSGQAESAFVLRWLQSTLLPEPGDTLSVEELELAMRKVMDDGAVGKVSLDLQPGTEPGHGRIVVETDRPEQMRTYGQVGNSLPKSLGATVAQTSLVLPGFEPGFDSVTASLARGAGFSREALRYDGRWGTGNDRWSLAAGRSHSRFVEDYFRDLSIESRTYEIESKVNLSIWNRYHKIRTGREVELSNNRVDFSFGIRNTTTRDYLLGSPFSFDRSARDGWIDVLEISSGIEARHDTRRSWMGIYVGVRRGTRGVLSQLHDDFGSARYTVAEGALDVTRLLTSDDLRLQFRAKGQKAMARVVPSARFLLGGGDTVRGIDAGALSGDSGFASSLDLALPVYRTTWLNAELRAFTDIGAVYGWEGGSRRACTIGAGPDLRIAEMVTVNLAATRRICGDRDLRRSGSHTMKGLLFNIGWKTDL